MRDRAGATVAITGLSALLVACELPPALEIAVTPGVCRGSGLVRQVCAQLHDIATGSVTVADVDAPSCDAVANRPGTAAAKLRNGVVSSHPPMQTCMSDAASVGDVAAFMLSLRRNH